MYPKHTGPRVSPVSQALAGDRIGIPSVWALIMAGIAPLTVAAGVIPSAYATTGLTAIPLAFLAVAIVLALFVPGYMAMTRHIKNAGACYAFITRGLGKPLGVAAALVALLAYNLLQVGLYGAFGPAAQSEAARYLHLNAPWWTWALAAWAVVTALGLMSVNITGKVLGVLTIAEVAVIAIEIIDGLAHPADGHLSLPSLSPGSAGWVTFGVLAVVAGLGFVGFEQGAVLREEARNPRRTIPAATYLALTMIAVVYWGASFAMAAHAGAGHVVAAAASQGPELMFGMGGATLAQIAQILFMTSLFAALLAFHNAVWRYTFSLARERVLPAFLSRTGRNSVPKAASLAQSTAGLAVIAIYASGGWAPMTDLFFWLGTTGGLGILALLALTSVAVIRFFYLTPAAAASETAWARLIAPVLSAICLGVIVVLAVLHYATLLGVPPQSAAAWLLPASFAAVAVTGLGVAAVIRARRPDVYATIGLGAEAVTGQPAPVSGAYS